MYRGRLKNFFPQCVCGETDEERDLKCERRSHRSRSANKARLVLQADRVHEEVEHARTHARQLRRVPASVSPFADKSEAAAFAAARARKNSPADGLFTSASCVSVTIFAVMFQACGFREHALVYGRVFSYAWDAASCRNVLTL